MRNASPYLVHIYVLPETLLDAYFGALEWRSTTEEYLCGGHECVGVTQGLYLSADELGNPVLLADFLDSAIGLE